MSRIKRLYDAEDIKVEYLKIPGGTRIVFRRNDPFGRNGLTEVWPKLTSGEPRTVIRQCVAQCRMWRSIHGVLRIGPGDVNVRKLLTKKS